MSESQSITLQLSDLIHSRQHPDRILDIINTHNMTQYYLLVTHTLHLLPFQQHTLDTLQLHNKHTLTKLDQDILDAVKNLGETEVRDAHLAKARFFDIIGDKQEALKNYEETLAKTVGIGQKIDLVFEIMRLGFAWKDTSIIKSYLLKAKDMVEQGGDWERRNRLKVYEGTYSMIIRDFKQAALLFLDSIATFTCTELYEYNRFVWNTIISCMISVDRMTLKEKLIQSPDILSVIHDIPNCNVFLNSFHKCQYKEFFRSLVEVMDEISRDRYVSLHQNYYLREIRIVAYTQFLQSYKSVTLQSMARSFGVSESFLDADLSQFISSKKLSCKIDRVRGVLESSRLDGKNLQYQSVLKHGDVLLNRLQKLSRVITY